MGDTRTVGFRRAARAWLILQANVGLIVAHAQTEAVDTALAVSGPQAKTYALDINLVENSHYYLIVSKALPGASGRISKFNDGLKHIRGNGTYKKLVKQFGSN